MIGLRWYNIIGLLWYGYLWFHVFTHHTMWVMIDNWSQKKSA